MRLIGESTLTGFRWMNQENLLDTVEVRLPVTVREAGGYTSSTFPNIDLVTVGRLSPLGSIPEQAVIAGKVTNPERTYLVSFAQGTVIPENAQLHVNGKILNVIGVMGKGSVNASTKVIGEEVASA